jgi:hypothetical protein
MSAITVQFQHLHRTPFFPIMLPTNNQIAIVDPVPMARNFGFQT